MARTRKAFAAAAIAALIAPAAVVAALSNPALADGDGKHRHDLDTYKREAWVALGGAVDPPSVTLSMLCDTGDYALDGMWKVDAHDGDDRTVRASISRRHVSIKERWDFTLHNDGSGRAQIKTFVTCLDSTTGARDNHTHQVLQGTRGDGLTGTTAVAAGATVSMSATCAPGHIPVSPSFLLTGSDARLIKSYPSVNKEGWEWAFKGGVTDGTVDVSIYCIQRTTSGLTKVVGGDPAPGSHTHDIDADLIPGYAGVTETVPVNTPGIEFYDYRITSRPHDEGNVGAFMIIHPANTWYLGQDAQGQVRGFRFGNTGGTPGDSVRMAVWGFDKRTTRS